MKTVEEIERLERTALETIVSDSSVEVPASLGGDVRAALAVKAMSGRKTVNVVRGAVVALAAAASLLFVLLLPGRPRDTFEDPALAYAELERTFSYISSKMDRGLEIASGAESGIELAAAVYKQGK